MKKLRGGGSLIKEMDGIFNINYNLGEVLKFKEKLI